MTVKWYTLDELSNILGVSVTLLREWCKGGRFPNAKKNGHWRVPESDVEALAPGQKKAGPQGFSEERTKELADLNYEAKRADAEASKITAGIKLAEIKGERDRPEILAKKKAELDQREQNIQDVEGLMRTQGDALKAKEGLVNKLVESRKAIGADLIILKEYGQALGRAFSEARELYPERDNEEDLPEFPDTTMPIEFYYSEDESGLEED